MWIVLISGGGLFGLVSRAPLIFLLFFSLFVLVFPFSFTLSPLLFAFFFLQFSHRLFLFSQTFSFLSLFPLFLYVPNLQFLHDYSHICYFLTTCIDDFFIVLSVLKSAVCVSAVCVSVVCVSPVCVSVVCVSVVCVSVLCNSSFPEPFLFFSFSSPPRAWSPFSALFLPGMEKGPL